MSLSEEHASTVSICCYDGCNKRILNLGRHLKKSHNLQFGSFEYNLMYHRSKDAETLCPQSPYLEKGQGINSTTPNESLQLLSLPSTSSANSQRTIAETGPKDSSTPSQTTLQQFSTISYQEPCCTDLSNTREAFFNWLGSVAGGLKGNDGSKQHESQAFALFSLAASARDCGSTFPLCQHVFFRPANFNIAMEKLRKDKKNRFRAPGTLMSYLTSGLLFIRFLYEYTTDELFLRRLEVLKLQMKAWIKTLSRASKQRARLRAEKDREELLTPMDIKQYMKSASRRRALRILRDPATTELRKKDRFNIRNTLLLDTALQCGQRSGAIKGLTKAHLRCALEVPMKSGSVNVVLNVEVHKTSAAYGPAKVVISKPLYADLLVYSKMVNDPSNGQEDGLLFTTYSGKSMTNGGVNAALLEAWKRSDGRQKAITSTFIRKSITTVVSRRRPGIWAKMARLLAHSVATSWRSYALLPSDPEMATTAARIRRVVGLEEVENDDDTESFADDCSDCEAVTANLNDTLESNAEQPTLNNSGHWAAQSSPEQDSNSSSVSERELTFELFDPATHSSGTEHCNSRRKLNERERVILRQHYGDLIDAKRVTLKQFRELSTRSEAVCELIETHSLLTVYESLRSMCRK